MGALDAVQLTPLMERTSGRAEIRVGLIDGPVFLTHPDLAQKNIQEVPGKLRGTCSRAQSAACLHGTFVAGMLCARRGSVAPAICPGCTLLVRPIFSEANPANGDMPLAERSGHSSSSAVEITAATSGVTAFTEDTSSCSPARRFSER